MPNANFDTLLSTTLHNYRNKMTDNIMSGRAFLKWLTDNKRVRKINGGATIVEQLFYATNTTATSYSDYDAIALTAQTPLTAAQYNWKQFAASIAVTGIEEAKNNGEAELMDLVKAKVMQAEETVKETLDAQLFTDGTGNGGKNWDGLAKHISTTVIDGGIDPATDTWWKAQADSTTTALTIPILSHVYNLCTVGDLQPDFAITTMALWEKYESLLQPQLRYEDTDMASAGFQNLMYKKAPLFWDINCQANTLYLLNSKGINLVTHSENWLKIRDWVQKPDVDARFALILSYGNLTVNNRRLHGILTNKS